MYSYNIEQASGHGGHNIITVVMNEKGVDLNGALAWLGEYHAARCPPGVLRSTLMWRHLWRDWVTGFAG